MEQPEFPEWAYICNGVKRFTSWEAIRLISWNNPYSEIWPEKDEQAFIDAIAASIDQAVEDEDLIPTGKKVNGDQDTFDREELRAWAKSVGYGWPLPPLPNRQSTPAPAADSALLEKVQQLEAQNAALMQQVAALERQLEQASAVQPQELEPDFDPSDFPEELNIAINVFHRVRRGYGTPSKTFRNRLIECLEKEYPDLLEGAVERIATVANNDKGPGRKPKKRLMAGVFQE